MKGNFKLWNAATSHENRQLRRTENQDSHKAFREEIQNGEQSTGERQLIRN